MSGSEIQTNRAPDGASSIARITAEKKRGDKKTKSSGKLESGKDGWRQDGNEERRKRERERERERERHATGVTNRRGDFVAASAAVSPGHQ